jgi:hypothetical protein
MDRVYTLLLAALLLFITAYSSAQTFTSQSSGTFPNIANPIKNVIADFDGDGDADILSQTGTTTGQPFNYATNNGNGTFTTVTQAASPFAGLTLPDIVTFPLYRTNDYDGDGDIDIWIPAGGATGTYLRNDGNSFSSQSTTTFPNAQFTVRNIVADFDGDGDADVLFQTNGNSSGFSFARNNGNASFTTVAQSSSPFAGLTLPDVAQTSTYRTADFDGDGDIDIWATANNATGTYFRNDGATFSSQSTTTFPAAEFMGRSVIGDFDADGDADILFQTHGDASAFSYATSNGDGTFTIVAQASSPFANLSLDNISTFGYYKPNDFDGDGDIDLWMAAATVTGTYYNQNGSPPTLTSTNPANDAAGVLRDANINLNFTESVTKNTGNITIVRSSDNTVIETINVTSGQVTGSGTAYVINPSTTLASNTTFSLRIAAGAFLDASSTEFPGIYGSTLQFTTGTALPLFWLSANAVFENGQVNISWKTTHEQHTSHFEVERSIDGASYNNIGQISSANSAGEHQYAFADKGVQPGYTYYYRIRQVDMDGRFNYSSTLKVDIGGERRAALRISNNPVRSDMIVSISLPRAQNASLVVLNQAGATVLERKENLPAGETIMSIRTSSLPTGIYYLVLYAGRDKLRAVLIKQ